MLCPKCGAENKDGAKFCKKCGAPLDATTNERAASGQPDTNTAGADEAKADKTTAAQTQQPGATGGAAASAAAGTVSGAAAGAKPKKISKPVIIGGIAAVVIIVAIAVVMVMSGGIGEKEFKEALQDGNMLTIKEGDYNDESQLNVDSVKITSNEKATGDDAAMARMWYGTDELYEVTGDVKLSNDAAEVDETVTCYFMKDNNKWVPVGSPDVQGDATWTAKQGPSEDRVQENIDKIVNKAFENIDYGRGYDVAPDKAIASSSDYDGADISITDSQVNGNQATVTLSAKKSGSYYSCGGSITANFKFTNGRWSLDSADADDSVKSIDFSGIIGTWSGTCTDPAYNCNAANGQTVSVTITSFDSSTGNISGTISCPAHFHNSSEANGNSDTTLTDAPFTAVLTTATAQSGTNLSGKFLTLKHDTGKIAATISFMSSSSVYSDGNEKVVIDITTANDQSWSTYRDEYTLTKAA